MAVIEIQVRTDRFGELIRGELSSRVLKAPTLNQVDDLSDTPVLADLVVLKGKLLESVRCVACSLSESDGNGTVRFVGNVVL